MGERGVEGDRKQGGVGGADLRARRLLIESSSFANLATVEPGGAAEAPTPPADAKPKVMRNIPSRAAREM